MNFDLIRLHYGRVAPEIMRSPKNAWAVDPYAWNSVIHMTPIEDSFWSLVRDCGAVMYPQWPAARYFLDFANPVAKIAVECDGRQFHDAKRDAIRDAHLRVMGWSVYRYTGSDCWRMQLMQHNSDGTLVYQSEDIRRDAMAVLRSHGVTRE